MRREFLLESVRWEKELESLFSNISYWDCLGNFVQNFDLGASPRPSGPVMGLGKSVGTYVVS